MPGLVVIILLTVVVGLWVLGAVIFLRVRKAAAGGIKVIAEVYDFASYTSHAQTMYCAQYRATIDGTVVTGAATNSKTWKSPAIGTKLAVRYHPHAENKLADASMTRYIAPIVLAVVGAMIGGFALDAWHAMSPAFASHAPSATTPKVVPPWDGTTRLRCTGDEQRRVEHVTAKLDGTAITATGNCKLTLVEVDVSAETGIHATGDAIVTVEGGSITGSSYAIRAVDHAAVHLTGTKTSGRTQQKGSAVITGP